MKKMIALAALAILSHTAMAADKNPGWYAGFSLGSTKFKVEDESERKTSFGANLGYAFNANLATEVQVQRLGRWSEDGDTLTATSVNASLLGKLPVSDTISLFGRAGWSRNTLEVSEGAFSASVHKNKALFGLGADFQVGSNMSIRAEYVDFGKNTIGDGSDSISIKIQQFNVGMNFAF